MRRTLWITLLLPLSIAACGPGQVIVTTEMEVLDPESGERVTRPIERLPVQLIPFDRDHVFDSLTQAAARPEPELSPELFAARDSIRLAGQAYREAETELLALRDQLRELGEEMREYNPAEPRYRELFAQFNTMEERMLAAERRRDENFERFTDLQQATFQELEQARIQLENWEDEAFADYPEIVAVRLQETRREILADTTDATGMARFQAPPGEWWVYARRELMGEELYWNIRVEVERGEPIELLLNRGNAEVRPVF